MRPSIGLPVLILSISATTFALGGCSKSQPGPEAMPPADTALADAAAQAAEAKAAEEAKIAELAAREQELAAREAELKMKELETELARRDAESAAAAAAKAASAKRTSAQNTAKAPAPTAPKTTAPVYPIVVPAGTQLAIELTTPLSTKTNLVGDRVQGRLASDLVVDGRRAAKAGATVQGSVTQVVSGSKKVGGIPVIGLTFDSLVAANGSSVSINAPYSQQGKSETAKDTAKIVGGAAAGAIIGHQVDSDKGSVIGGILGGAAGTAAAHKTGGEVALPAGQVVTVATGSSFEVRP